MEIVVDYPPMFEQIAAVFPDARQAGVVFTWGQKIYSPTSASIPREIVEHEKIHAQRQGSEWNDIVAWWEKYLVDPGFRLMEELPAHRAEYKAYCKRHGKGRSKYLGFVAARLASPLYGGLVSPAEAETMVLYG